MQTWSSSINGYHDDDNKAILARIDGGLCTDTLVGDSTIFVIPCVELRLASDPVVQLLLYPGRHFDCRSGRATQVILLNSKGIEMELLVDLVGCYSCVLAPALATFAMIALYVQPVGSSSQNNALFFAVLLVLATLTVRTTMMMYDETWLIHAASLGCTIVAGAMKRPQEAAEASFFHS